MEIKPFFTLDDNQTASLYTLANSHGFKVDVTDFGGCLVSIIVPDRNNRPTDVLLGFKKPQDYINNPPFFGALIGRFANRIAYGTFTLNGKTYKLACNDGANRPNALHGVNCYGKRLWKATPVDDSTLRLQLTSPDGDAGFPGKLDVTVTYQVTENNEIRLSYQATTDAPTVLNFTNHAYFNLNGEGALECRDHRVSSVATTHTEVNQNLIPTGVIAPVAHTPFDLTHGRTFEDIYQDPNLPSAFDDNFIVAQQPGKLQTKVFTVTSSRTGITLEVDTDQPGVQFYMAAGLNNSCLGKSGKTYPPYGAFCLEAQNWPDAPNHPNFPSAVLNPGETYSQTTVYRFSTQP